MTERLPDPVVPSYAWCETCLMHVPVIDEFDEQIGFEERAREVCVTALDCGHDIARPA